MKRKADLIKIGMVPVGFGILLFIIDFLTKNTIILSLISLSFILLWGYFGYDLGKDKDSGFKDIILIHLIAIIIICIQIIEMILTSMESIYNPLSLSQLYFLPIVNLIIDYISTSLGTTIIISFLVMVLVFSIGLYKGNLEI